MHVVLQVRHKGKTKMVGKVFPVGKELIFMHEAAGNQWHINLNSPGGIDVAVIEWLLANKVDAVHHYDRDRNTLYVANTEDIDHYGVPQLSDGRYRLYLSAAGWAKYPGKPSYKVPWVTTLATVDTVKRTEVKGPKATGLEPKPEPVLQDGLF